MAQTLASEAWMALSLDVSRADVAYREGLGKMPLLPKDLNRKMPAASEGSGMHSWGLRRVKGLVKHGLVILVLGGKWPGRSGTGTDREDRGEKAAQASPRPAE